MSEERISGVGGVLFKDGSVMIILEDTDNPEYLKLRGMLSVPLGHIESGEGLEEAAEREFFEETGISVRVILPISDSPFPVGIGDAYMFLMEEREMQKGGSLQGRLNPRWMPVEDLLNETFVRSPTKEAVRRAVELRTVAGVAVETPRGDL